MPRPIYMDHHATTPLDKRVLDAMLPYLAEAFGNASSTDHAYGAEAAAAVEDARQLVARLVGAKAKEVVFLSGATEADNLALLGTAQARQDVGNHIITCQTEHPAVLDTCQHLERHGFSVTYLPVDGDGFVDPSLVGRAITKRTVLVSVMMANNEVGTLAPITEISRITRAAGVPFHSDAAQAAGTLEIDVDRLGVDLLSLSGHKFYGPKGVGALIVRKAGTRAARLSPQMHGGGHERGLRSGTFNVPSIVGFAKALQIANDEREETANRLAGLRDALLEQLRAAIPGLHLNGPTHDRLPHNLNITIDGVDSRTVLLHLHQHVALSMGSACSTTRVEPSHVLLAMGCSPERAYSSLRFGLGRSNTAEEISFVAGKLAEVVREVRRAF